MDQMGGPKSSPLRREELLDRYPGLATSHFRLTSPDDSLYNCYAFAGGDTRRNWHPSAYGGLYWPGGASEDETLEAFLHAYSRLGYRVCVSDELEPGLEKIAIYADAEGPSHAARQLPNGYWTSKLGPREDIEHELRGLEGDRYGRVVAIAARPLGGQEVLALDQPASPQNDVNAP